MIEWALLAFALTAPAAGAAVKMHAARLKHTKWEVEQALKCPHVWSGWDDGKETKMWASPPGKYPVGRQFRHKRTCELCGDIDYKTWDTATSAWLNH